MFFKIESVSLFMDCFKCIDYKGCDFGDIMFFIYFKEKYVNWVLGYVFDLIDILFIVREYIFVLLVVMI